MLTVGLEPTWTGESQLQVQRADRYANSTCCERPEILAALESRREQPAGWGQRPWHPIPSFNRYCITSILVPIGWSFEMGLIGYIGSNRLAKVLIPMLTF